VLIGKQSSNGYFRFVTWEFKYRIVYFLYYEHVRSYVSLLKKGGSAFSLAIGPLENPNICSAGTPVGVGREASNYVSVRIRYNTINIAIIT